MKLAIMQPYFFPYIGYWQVMNSVDQYVIYDDVNYIKGGWVNRNHILMNGQSIWFNLILDHPSPYKKINEVKVSPDEKSRRNLLKTLEGAYKKAPYFQDVYPVLQDAILQDEDNLARYLIHTIRSVHQYLGMKTNLLVSSDLKKDNSLKGADKVLAICKELNADEYHNSIGGIDLYSKEQFLEQGIRLCFVKAKEVVYKQFKNDFIPNLSIIDVMMFNSKEQIQSMLEEYTLL